MKFFVDRIEGEWAVLASEDQVCFDFPARFLPADAKEGVYLDFDIHVDEGYTDKKREEIRSLQQKLLNKKKK